MKMSDPQPMPGPKFFLLMMPPGGHRDESTDGGNPCRYAVQALRDPKQHGRSRDDGHAAFVEAHAPELATFFEYVIVRVVRDATLASPRGARAVEKDDEDEVEDGHRNEPGKCADEPVHEVELRLDACRVDSQQRVTDDRGADEQGRSRLHAGEHREEESGRLASLTFVVPDVAHFHREWSEKRGLGGHGGNERAEQGPAGEEADGLRGK